jgi:hypothetical protein
MSDSIETLLVRNLHEVFGERDPARRTIAIEAIFDRDCLFSDPPHQQQASIRRLVAAVKIHCEFLAPDRWQVERKRCSFGHGGCGAPLIRDAIVSTPICCVNRSFCATAVTQFSCLVHNPG